MSAGSPRALGALVALLLVFAIGSIVALAVLVATLAEDDEQTSATSCIVTAVTTDDDQERAPNIPNGWAPLVEAAAQTAGLPVSVVAAQLQQESNWDPNAGSSAGAQGIAQFMPATWATYGNGGEVTDPDDAIPAYGRYMAALKKDVEPLADGDADQLVRLTLAAYNAGPGAVQQYKGVPPYEETQNYVRTILDVGQSEFSAHCQAPTGAQEWDGDLGDGEWTTPLPGGKFTSGYGGRALAGVPGWANQHEGVDIATPGAGNGRGGVVVAPTSLRITGFNATDGCVIAKENGEDPDFGFAFCHLHSWDVAKGQKLKRGDVIGTEGNRGRFGMATHLHFEIYTPDAPDLVFPYQGHNIDPEPILKQKGAWPK
ncbi:transglycosylase SLT domain-containing protein [Kocuria sediminis]|uniref:Transglycosylase SLT domain-containing protein n=1 Tax=Kocuria sediminis TaxID=1038857 RepID=A0A6N8GNG6_9MICC|nr:transglycosylase SLT domain-containing protein [Kocuria sediminis]MUN64666.1 transglycosylase SLT domain-containing protein [Kocuria sediminis]